MVNPQPQTGGDRMLSSDTEYFRNAHRIGPVAHTVTHRRVRGVPISLGLRVNSDLPPLVGVFPARPALFDERIPSS
ncbi:hypothetical protein EVAR_14364_1 [Eumeta japonica]|uniref:Uncharacterized protein n=1 Tax=Eumeta variegata TaxID=151549 RepID=A0A4C1TXI5_EUMVA|nr:hypothetical protein EVAR_14364_1 [Eumeta japonica]